MAEFAAIILICLNSMAPQACTRETAADVLSIHAESELDCLSGWQEVIARSPLAREIGSTAYLKTSCERVPEQSRNRFDR